MLALYRSGRQTDALAAYRRLRGELNATLALEPTQALRDLERQILVQDPALAPPAAERPEQQRRLPITVAAVGFAAPGDVDPEVYA
jgi:DNA-binding SARP family transcriptional activator